MWFGLFREDQLVAAGELQPILLAAMPNDQLPMSGEQILARDDSRLIVCHIILAFLQAGGEHLSPEVIVSRSCNVQLRVRESN
jgi:hypothetical protein